MAFTNRDVENIVIEAIGRFATGEHNEINERKVLEWLRRNYTAVEEVKTYYGCQTNALIAVELDIIHKNYNIVYPDHDWTKHIPIGDTANYEFPLRSIKSGKKSKLQVHIQIYRKDIAKYELNHYIS
jgi:hypothetical protein